MDRNFQHHIYDWKQAFYRQLTSFSTSSPEQLERMLKQGFFYEERLMICSGYPDYEHQYSAHRDCLALLTECGADQAQFQHLQNFLQHWMRQHDLLYDRYFQIFFDEWQRKEVRFDWTHWNPEYVLLKNKLCRMG